MEREENRTRDRERDRERKQETEREGTEQGRQYCKMGLSLPSLECLLFSPSSSSFRCNQLIFYSRITRRNEEREKRVSEKQKRRRRKEIEGIEETEGGGKNVKTSVCALK